MFFDILLSTDASQPLVYINEVGWLAINIIPAFKNIIVSRNNINTNYDPITK